MDLKSRKVRYQTSHYSEPLSITLNVCVLFKILSFALFLRIFFFIIVDGKKHVEKYIKVKRSEVNEKNEGRNFYFQHIFGKKSYCMHNGRINKWSQFLWNSKFGNGFYWKVRTFIWLLVLCNYVEIREVKLDFRLLIRVLQIWYSST